MIQSIRNISFFFILFILLLICYGRKDIVYAGETEAEKTEKLQSISFGTTGDSVVDLQKRLQELGYYTKSIDGDYGNGTKTAVSSFQARNSITPDGIASEETITAIFSDEAIPAPDSQGVEIVSVSFDKDTGYALADITNHLGVTVDSMEVYLLTYGAGGEIYVNQKSPSQDEPGLISSYHLAAKAIDADQTERFDLDVLGEIDYNVKHIGLYIKGYHTTDGAYYEYSPEQIYVIKSDGSVEYPSDEADPDKMSDKDYDNANTVKLGFTYGIISKWLSKPYMLPTGEYVTNVSEGSIFDLAGIRAGDVIVAYDDIPALNGNACEHAKLSMLDGNAVAVTYKRNGVEETTQIATDMSSVNEIKDSGNESTNEPSYDGGKSISEQLTDLASLYSEGLLTEEEFNAAKAALLG